MEKAQRTFCFFLPIVYTKPVELENNLLWLAASFIKISSLSNIIWSNFPLKLWYRSPSLSLREYFLVLALELHLHLSTRNY